MNNELADKIEDARNETDFQKWAGQAPDMLRQQQAEIANLKAGLLSHHDIYPVKELTDEEIEQVMVEAGYGEVHKFVNPFDFARAILRKAHSNCNGFCGEYECKENQAGCKRKAQE